MRKNLFGFIIKSQNITNFAFLDFLSPFVLGVQNRYKEKTYLVVLYIKINEEAFFNFENKWVLNAFTEQPFIFNIVYLLLLHSKYFLTILSI